MKAKLLLFLPLLLVVARPTRGQYPAGGGATGSPAGESSGGSLGEKPAVAIPAKVLQR